MIITEATAKRIAEALERIDRNLEKLAYPPMVSTPPTDTSPGNVVLLRPRLCWREEFLKRYEWATVAYPPDVDDQPEGR